MLSLLSFIIFLSIILLSTSQTCTDNPFSHQFTSSSSCSSAYIIDSSSSNFPSACTFSVQESLFKYALVSTVTGINTLSLDISFKIITICTPQANPLILFSLEIAPGGTKKQVVIMDYDSTSSKFRLNVQSTGGTNSYPMQSTTTVTNGDQLEFFLTINTASNKVRGLLVLADGKIEDTATQTRNFNNWKFDSSTKMNICSNSLNTPHAYCEVLGMQTWYTYSKDPLPLYLLGGLYPTPRGFFTMNEDEGYILNDQVGLIGTAYLGDSTSTFNDTVHAPKWKSERIRITSPNQYVTFPTFQLYPRYPDEKASFTISLWIKPFQTGNNGYIFRRTSQDKSTDRFSLSIDVDNKIIAKVGPFNSPIVSKTTGAILPEASWTQVTITFILASDTKTSYIVCYFNNTVVISHNPTISVSSLTFLSTDKTFFAGGLTPSNEIRFRYLYIFSPGSIIFTDGVPCSGSTLCQRSLGSPNAKNCIISPTNTECDPTCLTCFDPDPNSCLTCPSNRYFKDSSCLLSCYTYPDGACLMHCSYPYLPRNESAQAYCDFRCSNPSPYLYPNGSCLSHCSFPSVKYQNKSTEWYCRGPCTDNTKFYYPDQKLCLSSCNDGYQEDFSAFYKQCVLSPVSSVTKSIIDATEKGQKAASAVTQATAALSSGSPTGISATVAGKIFSNIKYLNISYSNELEDALINWGTSFISLEFLPDMPPTVQQRIITQPVPYMFEKYNIKSSFLLNFWNNLCLLLILTAFFIIVRLLEFAALRSEKPQITSKLAIAREMTQNFLLTQLYSVYGDIIFYAALEYRSIHLNQGLFKLSFSASLTLLLIIILSLSLHFYLLHKYQKIKKQTNPELLAKYINSHKGNFVLFRDFKDVSLLYQSFLLLLTARDLAFSLILTTMFHHPLAQTVLILVFNVAMFGYLILRPPFVSLLDATQQLFYEFITMSVNVSVLIMAIMDKIQSNGYELRMSIGKFVIITNLIFNFGSLAFMLIKGWTVIKEIYEAYKIQKKEKSNAKPKIVITLAQTKKPVNRITEQSKSSYPSFSLVESAQDKSKLSLIPPKIPTRPRKVMDLPASPPTKIMKNNEQIKQGKNESLENSSNNLLEDIGSSFEESFQGNSGVKLEEGRNQNVFNKFSRRSLESVIQKNKQQ